MLDASLKPKIAAAACGLVCLDIFPDLSNIDSVQFESQFKPGRVMDIAGTNFGVGGSATNTGISLHHLGIDTTIVGLIGADFYGKIIRQIYEREGPRLNIRLIEEPRYLSGHTYIVEPRGSDRRFMVHAGANDSFSADHVPGDVLAKVGLLHFGYPSILHKMMQEDGAEIEKLYRRAKAQRLVTSLDTALPDPNGFSGRVNWRRLLERSLPLVDLFLPSFEELVFMLDRERYDRLSQSHQIMAAADLPYLDHLSAVLLAMGTKIVLIKIGDRGLYLRTADIPTEQRDVLGLLINPQTWSHKKIYHPAFQVEVSGTTGAGDAAIAGFLSAVIRGFAPEDALKLSAGAGACCCEQADSVGGVPSWEVLCERINRGWKTKTEVQLGTRNE